ncbi:hypothetical protein BU26DRAFT_559513 [Trematosphaeria pertusa]|uniref:F-box domain-containing protein n=1 Tax=Trematosphaeria pertusa TaxID=390896 RepID=A0A6A6IWU2_9PLEO|nr:uncharacterized protein BU26DRAFT_559513 [Trematosphaeria pertusa]KAF2254864.1 hypothetical protein BU26DRAFT_559513 [Trematosphaeria pertusa]
MASIQTLPAELINEITSHLRPHDLTRFARVSKQFREFAQSTLWRSIELHRKDAHHGGFGLTIQQTIPRMYLDDVLRGSWSYRSFNGDDPEFDRRNAKFGTAIRTLYRTAGKSHAWMRLSGWVRHLCLTVGHKTPGSIWNAILSLPTLGAVEVIGEYSLDSHFQWKGPPKAAALRQPSASKIRNVRLRGYIPSNFVSMVCKASAKSIVSLDLGMIEEPNVWEGDLEDMELQEELGYPLFAAPRGVLWFPLDSAPLLPSVTHLLLCKRGHYDPIPEMSEPEDLEYREDESYEIHELKHWAVLLKSVRSTVVEVVLEQRPVMLEYILDPEYELSPHDHVFFDPECLENTLFWQHVVRSVFDDGAGWPKLARLIFRGVDERGFEQGLGESLQAFASRVLPGVQVDVVRGTHMFFSTRHGTISNRHGADGLKPHLDPTEDPNVDFFGGLFL